MAHVTIRAIDRIRESLARASGLFRRSRHRADLDEEVQRHLEMEIEHLIQRGMTHDEARRAAAIAFGGVRRYREEADDARGFPALDTLLRHARYAARSLRMTPGFTATAALTIALGIAGATSVFGFVNAIFLRPLIPAQGDRAVRVFVQQPRGGNDAFGHAAVRLIASQAKSFDLVAEHYSTAPLFVSTPEWQSEIMGAVVSPDYFRLATIRPRLGRFFTNDDDAVPDRDPVAVIGEGLWQTRFGGDPEILRRTIAINGRSFQIVGVAPADFYGLEPDQVVNQVWIPTAMYRVGYRWCDPLTARPPCAMSHVFARLAPGATLATARAEMSAMRASLLEFSEAADSLRQVAVAPAVGFAPTRQTAFTDLAHLLWGISSILLAIACANLAGLLFVRGLARRRETALRLALGASRAHVAGQLMIENLFLGAIGGAAGCVLSIWGMAGLTSFFTIDSDGSRRVLNANLDLRVLGFAIVASLVATVLFGTVPAIAATRSNLVDSLKAGGRGTDGQSRVRHALVGAQVMLSVVLLVGAGLFTRSVTSVLAHQRFDPSQVVLMRLRPRLVGYAPDKAERYLRDVVRQLAASPGVERVALARGVGLVWKSVLTTTVELPGTAPAAAGSAAADAPPTIFTTVSPGFFSTLGVPHLAGRDFTDRDAPGTPAVAIVNEALAKKLWPSDPAVGRPVMISGKPFTVVGVVANYRVHTATEPDAPMAFTPFWQNNFEPEVDARMAIRVKGDPASILAPLAKIASGVDPIVPVTELLPMTAQVRASVSEARLASAVLIGSGLLALFLSGIGLYGVVAFVVTRRTREVGIRLAVGARPRAIILLFVRQQLGWVGLGLVAGIIAAIAGARLIAAWLVGVGALDVASFAGAIGAVLVVALVGTLVPAWRAARIDPTKALRAE